MSDKEMLQAMADRAAITDIIYRYCRAVDRIDPELGYTVWHKDGEADYGDFFKGTGWGFIDHVCAAHRKLLGHSHQVSNIIIELDGDRAGSESYVTATLRLMHEETLLQYGIWARYVDRWSRRDGRWGIDSRQTIIDFDEVREIGQTRYESAGSRDRNDPSYAVLKSAP